MRVYVPIDASARALGADAVARAIEAEARRRGVAVQIIRNGSRGMTWLEPLVEVARDGVRIGFGPMTPADVAQIWDGAGLGPVDDLPWMRAQSRLTFARVGVIDPLDYDDFVAHGGGAGLRAARADPGAIIATVTDSGLRGRGGAGFPTGVKWRSVADAPGPQKYIICNADEGDSGSFADRMLIEGDPLGLIEGMAIAALAVGASRGYVYLRSEYPDAARVLAAALDLARARGMLGQAGEHGFDIELRIGAGAYVCGEETSLLNSLEGRRGTVRAKPPIPALAGFMGRPTVVNNVISLASVPWIMAHGARAYADFGLGRSRGTVPLQIAGNVARGGLFEAGFGMTLGQVVNDLAGGTATGRPVKAVQVGGPLGAFFPPALFDTPLGYEEFAGKDGLLGHAGIVVFDETTDMLAMARFAMEFCALESCGKCTPCRIGSVRAVETIDRIATGDSAAIPILRDLCHTMTWGSLCALGGFAPYPVMSALTHWPEDFTARQSEAAQ